MEDSAIISFDDTLAYLPTEAAGVVRCCTDFGARSWDSELVLFGIPCRMRHPIAWGYLLPPLLDQISILFLLFLPCVVVFLPPLLLQIKEDEVEEWLVLALKENLLDARLDQIAKEVHVRSAASRAFSEGQWQSLAKRLHNWRDTVTQLLKTVRQARQGTGL